MSTFNDFSEIVERGCVGNWRSALGRDNDEVIESVTGVNICHEVRAGKWHFELFLRMDDRWCHVAKDIDPIPYDLLNPLPVGKVDQSLREAAMQVVTELLDDMRGQMIK